ncbi:MAG: heparinase II/III family protein [Propionibacteriaceae bacterium]|nr:heparinase II/III family protein [Micropruina sp.]
MADISTKKRRGNWRAGLVLLLVASLLLTTKVVNYAAPKALRIDSIEQYAANLSTQFDSFTRNASFLHSCDVGTKLDVPGGYVCAPADATHDAYGTMFETYRGVGGAAGTVYLGDLKADQATADAFLTYSVKLPRFDPVQFTANTDWSNVEQPSSYWQFYYYGLRQTVPLTLAYVATHNSAYIDRVKEVLANFEANSATATKMWDDPHSVAFRANVLVWQWWTLREHHVLSEGESTALLREIQRTAEFLADPNQFQKSKNHGINLAGALLGVAVALPGLPGAAEWREVALTRLNDQVESLIDSDGILVENSPFYHVYVLVKLWQIRSFAAVNGIDLSDVVSAKIEAMVRVATYVLRPDGSTPEWSSSIAQTLHSAGTLADIAAHYPELAYVLTRGAKGTVPTKASLDFGASGYTVLRSPWGKGATFLDQSYLSFNTGAHRTSHSHLDLLSVTLFDNGADLLPEGGLYSDVPGPMHDYFNGSSAHNMVVVDGASETEAATSASDLATVDGVTYQSASTTAYHGVDDARTVAMVDKGVYLVVDRLAGETSHQYDQTWHLAPGATVSVDGLTVSGSLDGADQSVTISQLASDGISLVPQPTSRTGTVQGLCSIEYEVARDCPQFAYRQTGTSAQYVTLLTTGQLPKTVSARFDGATQTVTIVTASGERTIALKAIAATATTTHGSPPRQPTTLTPFVLKEGSWTTANAVIRRDFEDSTVGVTLHGGDTGARASAEVPSLDLTQLDLVVRARVMNPGISAKVRVRVASSPTAFAEISLDSVVKGTWDGQWINLTLPTGVNSDLRGRWEPTGEVDWTHITSLAAIQSSQAGAATLDLAWFATQPKPAAAQICFVFDDGYESILPAAAVMHEAGMPGNVAVIGQKVEAPVNGSLSTPQLKRLQNEWGWNMVNHTDEHRDVAAFYNTAAKGAAFEADLLAGRERLVEAGLNSAPNWFIYPHGTTNGELDPIVAKYYTFARTTFPGMDAFPYGSPMRVRNFEVFNADPIYPGSSDTSLSDVFQVIADAKQSRATLLMTFHRIQASPTERAGFPLAKFQKIVDAVKASGISVKTLSQLDTAYGMAQNQMSVVVARPAEVGLDVKLTKATPPQTPWWQWLEVIFG